MYGSLTTIVILMLWLYFCFYLFLIGAHVNRFPDTVSEGEGETEDTERKPVTSNITKNVRENGNL